MSVLPNIAVGHRNAITYARYDAEAAAEQQRQDLAARERRVRDRERALQDREDRLNERERQQSERESAALSDHVDQRLSEGRAALGVDVPVRTPNKQNNAPAWRNDITSAHNGSTAAMIVHMGEVRRNAALAGTPELTGLPAAIVRAGQKRRGEIAESDGPLVDLASLSPADRADDRHNGKTAQAILRAGRLRRGEISE